MNKINQILISINESRKKNLTVDEKTRLNFLIYALHRINDGRVYQNENKLITLVKEFTELTNKETPFLPT